MAAVVGIAMPVGTALLAGAHGALFGLFPILPPRADRARPRPGVDVLTTAGKPLTTVNVFALSAVTTAGTLMLVAGVIIAIVLRVGIAKAAGTWGRTVNELKWAILAVCGVLALAYVMNAPAQTTAIGLLAAANSSGGVLGKMLSPQNLAIAAVAVKLEGEEGTLLRKVIGWSLGMLLVLSTLIALQATPVLGWMLP